MRAFGLDTKDQLKKELQRHFTDGLAIVVGSGLSCAEGLSGMGALATHLNASLTARLGQEATREWATISTDLDRLGLEGALMAREPSDELDAAIAHEIVAKLGPEENHIIEEVLKGNRLLRFSKLVPHLLKTEKGIPILTTNYDRLIEIACETAGWHVDTMFDGSVVGRPDAKAARENLLRAAGLHGRNIRMRRRDHARIFKPHGSLDWYTGPDGPIRFAGNLELPRLVVSPGRRKLRKGYDRPFDEHRETMNKLLSETARLFVIGYGFNDDHLETHLSELISRGAPTLIITRSLSTNAEKIARENASVTAIDRVDDQECRIIRSGSEVKAEIAPIWDLGTFVDEVLRP